MTKLCSAFSKYENKLEIGRENSLTVLKCTQTRTRVENMDILGWNKSFWVWDYASDHLGFS